MMLIPNIIYITVKNEVRWAHARIIIIIAHLSMFYFYLFFHQLLHAQAISSWCWRALLHAHSGL